MLIASTPSQNTIIKEPAQKLVLMGFFLLPFENLIIAPSNGWPAISPVFFLLALLCMGRKKTINSKSLKWILCFFILSCVGWLVSSLSGEDNRYFIRDIASSLPPLIMGYAFYQSTHNSIFCSPSPQASLKKLIDALLLGSKIALAISIIILIFTQILRTPAFVELASLILKRNQELLRFSFLFAEASFVSVHILGVLVPFAWITWRLGYREQFKSLVTIILTYIIISVAFLKSARFFLDISFLAFVLTSFYLGGSLKKLKTKNLILLITIMSLPLYFIFVNPTIIESLTLGRVSLSNNLMQSINSDASLASRYFRTDAVLQALTQNPYLLITGVGYGNIGALVDSGYNSALQNFTSLFTKEVDEIYIEGSGENIFNMYARFIGEFGLISFLFTIFYLYNKKTAFLFFITAWCYLQFDSYAFYSLWIYLLAKAMVNEERALST